MWQLAEMFECEDLHNRRYNKRILELIRKPSFWSNSLGPLQIIDLPPKHAAVVRKDKNLF